MKICSFLPAGTEIVCALGLADSLVGISDECNYPAAILDRPRLVHPAFQTDSLDSRTIDQRVAAQAKSGSPMYRLDEEALRGIEPDVIIAQDLCAVCAPSGNDVRRTLAALPRSPRVVMMAPHSLDDVFDAILSVGESTGTGRKAREILTALRRRATQVQCRTMRVKPRPRVFVLEWLDPPYAAGHWIPEMVELAGGDYSAVRWGEKSKRYSWEKIADVDPDVLILAPCGYPLARILLELEGLRKVSCRNRLKAFKTGEIYAVDADAYMTRPGPRVVDGIEILAHILHPTRWEWKGSPPGFQKISPDHFR